jgi:hypothetical protein
MADLHNQCNAGGAVMRRLSRLMAENFADASFLPSFLESPVLRRWRSKPRSYV